MNTTQEQAYWCCVLPLPPSANHCYRSYRGRVIKSKKYQNWQMVAALMAGRPEQLEGAVKITIVVAPGKKWNHCRDLDNLIKPIIDLVKCTGVIPDDNSKIVKEINITFGPVNEAINGCVTVSVYRSGASIKGAKDE